MDEYVSKPIHARYLLETIERLIKGSLPSETPSQGPPPGPDVADWSEVLKAAKGDWKAVETIVDAAAEESPCLLAAIRDAVASGDPTALRLAAHTLKGSVQYFGATGVFELARQLECLGQQGNLASAPATLASLEAEMTRFARMLAKYKEHAAV